MSRRSSTRRRQR